MHGKDEILAAIADVGTKLEDLGTKLQSRIDVIANGVGRIESQLGTVKETLENFRADAQDEFAIVKARLRALEKGKQQ